MFDSGIMLPKIVIIIEYITKNVKCNMKMLLIKSDFFIKTINLSIIICIFEAKQQKDFIDEYRIRCIYQLFS